MNKMQPWIHSRFTDGIFILLPPFLALLAIVLFPAYFNSGNEVNLAFWIVLVLMIDVAHVYSTLFRTYLDPVAKEKFRRELFLVPLLAWVAGVILYMGGALLFWKCLAYLAVFHFIRQQYGFMRIYARREAQGPRERLIDAFAIYSATLYPLFYWHMSGDRHFHWFVEGDFFQFSSTALIMPAFVLFILIQVVYTGKEIRSYLTNRSFNLPRNLIWLGTLLSWYTGIVLLNGDLTFTLTNVVTHGIPYMALVYFVSRKEQNKAGAPKALIKKGVFAFVLILVTLAFFEEGLWDAFVWREPMHESLFRPFHLFPQLHSTDLQALIIPLLAIPQVTHYVLDAFIWKINKGSRKVEVF